jgi:hypothetical protein
MDLQLAIQSYIFSLMMMNKIPMTQERLYWLRARAESAFNYELGDYGVEITPDLNDRSIKVEVVK